MISSSIRQCIHISVLYERMNCSISRIVTVEITLALLHSLMTICPYDTTTKPLAIPFRVVSGRVWLSPLSDFTSTSKLNIPSEGNDTV